MPRVVCRSKVSAIMSLEWEFMCIRTLSLANCSASWCWRRFHMSSAFVCRGRFSALTTCCSSQTPRRSVSPSSRHGRLVWKVKSSMSTWRRPSRPSSWSLLLAMLPSRNLASTPVLPALVVLAATQSQYSQCMWWVHKKCSGITKQLEAASNHVCRRCKSEARPINGRTVDVDGTMLDVEATFCYLCDILYSGAIAARCFVARGKFRKLLSVLTARYLSPWICGKVYEACVCPNNQELQWHLHKDCAMIRWICGIKDRDEIPPGSRLQKLGIENITSVLRFRRLSPVSNISQTFRFQALESKGGLRKHVGKCGLAGIDPLNRDAWRARVQHSLLLPTP